MNKVYKTVEEDQKVWPNGAVGYGPGAEPRPAGYLGRVVNCPVNGSPVRLACYATRPEDANGSAPACTRRKNVRVTGVIVTGEDGPVFFPGREYSHLFE